MTRVWFITGVSSGLGTEISLKALQASDKVIGTVRSRQRAAEAVKKIEDAGGKCVELDVTDAAASASVYKQSENEHGRIDVLCNNAGASWLGPVEDFT
jgi:NADP-dependent 3-hydroxy acid dehydrogenase YdfG